jgi:hypothetical protein
MKNSKREKDQDDGFKKTSGVNYAAIADRQVGDRRFERERPKAPSEIQSTSGTAAPAAVSSTFDAFQRMAAGLDGRTLADKMADPNRPTWEQYKKENEEKLDLVGNDVRKMVEYRAQLDKERDERLQRGTNHAKKSKSRSDDDDSSSSDDSSTSSSNSDGRKKKKKTKKHKDKDKKHKKHKDKKSKKKKKRSHDDSSCEENDSDEDRGHSKKRKKEKSGDSGGSMRLSDFMKSGGYDSS